MYRDQFGEFVCGYRGLKGYLIPLLLTEKSNSDYFKHKAH